MIITRKDINDFCRACTTEPSIADGHIYDVESGIIIPALGVTLFNDVNQHPEKYRELLHGCTYTNEKGAEAYHDGLIRTEAYFAYARIIRGGGTATRYGYVQKNGDYSTNSGESAAVRDASQIKASAELMLARVIEFCKAKGYIDKPGKTSNSQSIHVYKIGY